MKEKINDCFNKALKKDVEYVDNIGSYRTRVNQMNLISKKSFYQDSKIRYGDTNKAISPMPQH